jgi:hypothetical protein
MNNIYFVGDSHSIIAWFLKPVDHHWFGWAGLPVTMFQFINNEIPLFNLVERYNPGNICNTNIKKNDFVLFSFGWNDVQKNIYKYQKNNYKDFIDNITEKYVKKIIYLGKKFEIKPIIYCILPVTENIGNEINGEIKERIEYTNYMNKKLLYFSNKHDILFLDIYNKVSKDNIYVKEYVDDDMCHLNNKNEHLLQFLEKQILNICKNYTN